MNNKMISFIEKMPKAELHLHIEGSLEPELKFRLAERNNLKLPYKNEEEMRAAYKFDDLPSFLAVYYEGMSVLITEEDFYDLTMAYLKKAKSQNVLYSEIFFDPQAHTSRGISFGTVIRGIRQAQIDGEKELGIKTQLIMCFLRDMSSDSAMETLMQALPYKELIIGVGLDSNELENPPVKFKSVFERAVKEGFKITMHCDVDQKNSIDHIRQCLDDIHVDRIDHGVNSLDDESLYKEIVKRGLGLTVCPISNNYVVADYKAKEIRIKLEKGMRVTVNSDDPAYFPGYMNENLIVVQKIESLSEEQMIELQRNAFNISWLNEDEKEKYLKLLNLYNS